MSPSELINKILGQVFLEEFGFCPEDMGLSRPAEEKWGDFASNVALTTAKRLNQSPMEIANKISYGVTKLSTSESKDQNEYKIIESVNVAAPGFINLKISNEWLQNELLIIKQHGDSYGSSGIGRDKTVLIEFSQPNTNKPMHVGHARNNFLGSSMANILNFLSYKVIKSNYVGDIGVHICKSMLMYLKYGGGSQPTKKPDHFVGDFYIMFEKEVEKDPELLEEAKELLRRWEAGDKETIALWEKMNSWVYEGWKKTYQEENVTFDIWEYESKSINIGRQIAEYAVETGLARRDETGAIIAGLSKFGLPDKVLLRSDGTSVYSTKDLQLAKDSFEKYHFDRRFYVVDYRQEDYFKQIFKILEILGFEWASRLKHVSYGVVDLPEGSMSSRKGLVVNADDVLEKLYDLELGEIKERGLASDVDLEKTAKAVALSAFRYPLLKVDVKQNITFDYSHVTKLEGDTGPYLLYTHARACSVLRKSDPKDRLTKVAANLDLSPTEESLLRFLPRFPEVLLKAGASFSPNLLCNFLFELSARFNSFYNEVPILAEKDIKIRNFRLSMSEAVTIVLKRGLSLLGMEALERM